MAKVQKEFIEASELTAVLAGDVETINKVIVRNLPLAYKVASVFGGHPDLRSAALSGLVFAVHELHKAKNPRQWVSGYIRGQIMREIAETRQALHGGYKGDFEKLSDLESTDRLSDGRLSLEKPDTHCHNEKLEVDDFINMTFDEVDTRIIQLRLEGYTQAGIADTLSTESKDAGSTKTYTTAAVNHRLMKMQTTITEALHG